MKKIIYGGLFLTIVGISIVGCTKEKLQQVKEVNTQQSQPVVFDERYHIATDKKLLIFESSEAYESILSSTEPEFIEGFISTLKSMDLKSYQSMIDNNPNVKDEIGDDFLASMLNEDLTLKIGKFLYKIDVNNEKVYVLAEKNISDYQDLIDKKESNPNILVYSTEDEVIKLVENGLPSAQRGIFCSDRWAKHKSATSNTVTVSPTNGFQMVLVSKYQALGIYFVLKSIGQFQSVQNGELNYWFQLDNCDYSVRCGSSVSDYSHPWISVNHTTNGNTKTQTYRFYNGVKALKSYDYKVRYRCENSSIPSYPNPYTIFFTDYVHISD
ncbi:MAG: hypothetical protein IT237_11410 [Bacteroidia bacterium]|nr:hypothetical protein [Bacteroidia bacterium]MCZ2249326.1 hypothetical protein [Bacteroidia bacterium]